MRRNAQTPTTAVSPAVLDVTDQAGMAAWVAGAGRLDLVIANAGVSGGTGGQTEPAEQVQRIFATNLGGVLNTCLVYKSPSPRD